MPAFSGPFQFKIPPSGGISYYTRNVRLTALLQDVGGEFRKINKRPAGLILPGGGYGMCSDREAEVIAYPYLNAGYHAFVLRYSVAEHRKWPNPLNDYDQAMEMIRSKVEDWNILSDKIAVIGFSAGGHLAGCAATMAKNRPNAAILGYAAFAREIAQACQPEAEISVPVEHVDEKTCPCFIFSARDDSMVPVRGMLDFEIALSNYDIAFESHIYAYGRHGFGSGEASIVGPYICKRVPNWVQDSVSWLEDMFGALTPDGMQAPACAGKINSNWEDTLSVDCTLFHLKNQGDEAQSILSDTMAELKSYFAEWHSHMSLQYNSKLRDLLIMSGKQTNEISVIDSALRLLPNKKQVISTIKKAL